MPNLVISPEDGEEIIHEMYADEIITIGRAPDNTIPIEDASISSHHAQITVSGGGFQLKDLNSTNGTRHNGESVMEATCEIGDDIRFGKVPARIVSESAEQGQPLPEADAVKAELADTSQKPKDFQNASPFRNKEKKKNPVGAAVMSFALLSIAAFLYAVFRILTLTPPQ